MTIWQDVRFAGRLLVRGRWFTAVAIATFAIGLGAAISIYSIVDGLLVRPLPYKDADRIVQVLSHRMDGTTPVRSATMARPFFLAVRERTRTLSDVGGYDSFSNVTRRRLAMTIEGGPGVTELLGTRISPTLLSTLGVAPILGRTFDRADDQPGRNDRIILSERVWIAQLGSDPDVLGRTLRLDNRPYSVVGVMPRGFEFPDRQTDFWIPLTSAPVPPPSAPRSDSPNSAYADGVFGRLRDGVSVEAAAAEIESLLRAADLEVAAGRKQHVDETGFPSWMPRRSEVVSMKDELIAPARPLLRVLSFAVVCVLLIACANVINLLLAGAASRLRDTATRLALGARRIDVIRLALVESVLLSLAGGLFGIPVAYWTIRVITRLAPADLPRIQEVGLDMPLLVTALGLTLAAGIGAGLVPAVRVGAQSSRIEGLMKRGTAAGPGFGRLRLRGLLVTVEIALAVILLVGAGLMIRSFVSLNRVNLGYDARGVLAFQVVVPPGRAPDPAGFYAEVVRRLQSVPGVDAAGATDVLPLAGSSTFHLALAGLPIPPGRGDSMVMRIVSPGYFRALGIRVVAGRSFSERDGGSGRAEIVLNQEFARRYFGSGSPIGRIVGQGLDTYEVIGVVADVRHDGRDAEVRPEYYVDLRQSGLIAAIRPYIVVRSSADQPQLLAAIRGVVRQIDPQAGVAPNATAMADIVSESVSRPRFNTAVLGAFAAIAVVLAAIAVYGAMAYAVTRRAREIGVRMALGARGSDVVRLVVRQSAMMTGAGLLIGLACALAITRYMQSLLFGVSPLDAVTFTAVPLAFMAIAAVASWAPAHRATKVDPVIVLRTE